jgi:hypothetical protein
MSVNETGKGNRRFFAIVSLGKARWYWVVWPSLVELQTSQIPLSHVAEGYEKTKADAVEKALEVAGMHAMWIAAKYAKAYHHNTKIGTTRRETSPRIAESQDTLLMHEFLYRDVFDTATKQWESVPHRVVQRTPKYVYVEQQPYSPGGWTGSWLDGERPTYRLDRQTLEQNGYAFIPANSYLGDQDEPLFFSYDRRTLHGDQLPTCLQLLNLSWPCTAADVQETYRKLVKGAHPDGAGNHDKFLELQAAYEQALRLCR